MKSLSRASTGLDSLDTVIDHLRSKDNIVWQVDDISGYKAMVMPFVKRSLQNGHRVNYMRFAQPGRFGTIRRYQQYGGAG